MLASEIIAALKRKCKVQGWVIAIETVAIVVGVVCFLLR